MLIETRIAYMAIGNQIKEMKRVMNDLLKWKWSLISRNIYYGLKELRIMNSNGIEYGKFLMNLNKSIKTRKIRFANW